MLNLYPSDSLSNVSANTIMSDLPQCTGSEGAKKFRTAPNTRDAIWDRDENYIYMRRTDALGNIIWMERLKYELDPEPKPEDLYVTKEQFNELRSELTGGLSDVKEYISNLAATITGAAANEQSQSTAAANQPLPNAISGNAKESKGNGKSYGGSK